MDTNSLPPDDLSGLEQRLSAWRPSETGLSPDAALFAAGRASARRGRGRFVWPAASVCLAAVTATLGVCLVAERSERLALARELAERSAVPMPTFGPAPNEPSAEDLPTAPDGYVFLRREWERHAGDRGLRPAGPSEAPRGPASPAPPILRAWPPADPAEPLQ